jgi:hypothetical protein
MLGQLPATLTVSVGADNFREARETTEFEDVPRGHTVRITAGHVLSRIERK